MPFLRRRAQASESDMRRHKLPPDAYPSALTTKQLPELPHHPLSRPGSAAELPSAASALSADPVSASSTSSASSANGTTPSIPAPPVTPPHDDGVSSGHTATPSPDDPINIDRPDSPPIQEETPRHRRFSMLRFRNASDSQLSTRAKKFAQADEPVPPLPRPPEIITTAPTGDFIQPAKKASRMKLSSRRRRSGEESREDQKAKAERRRTLLPNYMSSTSSKQSITIEEPPHPRASDSPPQGNNGEPGRVSLALPTNRGSTSSRSDGSSGDRANGNTSATPTPTSSFFRLPRRRTKPPEPLFPISHLQRGHAQPSREGAASSSSLADEASDAVRPSISSVASRYRSQSGPDTPTQSRPSSRNGVTTPPAPSPAKALFQKANPSPATALFRPNSHNSGQSSPTRSHLNLRERSSTMSSFGRPSQEDRLAPPATRTSSSTGRKSFGDLLGLSRMRNNSEPLGMRQCAPAPATPGSTGSKNNSLQLPRDSVALPERREDENPGKYLDRLEEVVSRSVIAAALSKHTDPFSQAVLRSYMRRFSFFGDPMDMAIRKLLMEAELPKETQQIDRFLQAFANRYHECNPGIYASPDQAYFIAFSLLILHTDVFNKNNKHKMQKADYVKNTRGEGIFDEILDVFYDNITYTPFIHVEDDLDINGERIVAHKTKKKSIFPTGNNPEAALKKAAKEPIDPYHLILDNRLEILRPNLKDVMYLDDHYSYLGTSKSLNLKELQKTFFRTGVLQIVSARSRPDAFMSDKTTSNPEEAQPGVVDIKITKVGLLWRKDVKKKKTRSPWQEWGAILTGAQLYFFRNVAWVKSLMHQYEQHLKQGHDGIPIIFKPPLDQFKPDGLISTDGAVALLDSGYKKHKHAFVYVRHGGMEEVLLADDEDEMNDWLAKLNYAAAFRTSGVRMRGVVGGTYDGQGRRAIRRLDSESILTPSGEVAVARSRIDQKMALDILVARREIMLHKVAEANELLQDEEKKLELQLRNARHLQIMAPIQPKTREQMLLSAARIAAQLKWTRIEIWKTKCHRDILLLDMEEERELMDLPTDHSVESLSPEKTALSREESKGSGVTSKSPRSPVQLSLKRAAAAAGPPESDSPLTDVFQTPPTSATAASFHQRQNSREMAPHHVLETDTARKGSVSSAVSSSPSILASPPRKAAGSVSAPEPGPSDGHPDVHPDVDADEHDLLQEAGLVEPQEGRAGEAKPPAAAAAASEPEEAQGERRERHPNRVSADRLDRNKIRRSLQRTLREGAGHLSHARSKRGKELPAAGGAAAAGAAGDEAAQEPDVLTRGSGSFVVHGKKASVITFGSELQAMSPDERLRQRKASHAGLPNGASEGGAAPAPATPAPAGANGNGNGGGTPDYRAVLQSSHHNRGRGERRESAASASTATARSFHELHRKYSTAQAARVAALVAGGLAVPSDEESDAAVSFSDGTRTPLPAISTEGEEDEGDEAGGAESWEGDGDGEEDEDEGADEDEEEARGDELDRAESRQAQFYTPEPPASPSGSGREPGETAGQQRDRGEKDGLPSPVLQAVGA